MILNNVNSVEDLMRVLRENGSHVVFLRFTANWCSPCKRIEPRIFRWMSGISEEQAVWIFVDIDRQPQIYSFFKNKRLLVGVPTLFCYHGRESPSYIPDDIVSGADLNEIDAFFARSVMHIQREHPNRIV